MAFIICIIPLYKTPEQDNRFHLGCRPAVEKQLLNSGGLSRYLRLLRLLLSSLGVLGTCKERALSPWAVCYTSSAVSLSTRRCAIFHPRSVQRGCASALSFSVITHFDLDSVRMSRGFWQCNTPASPKKHQNLKKCECREMVRPTSGHETLKSCLFVCLPLLELFGWD